MSLDIDGSQDDEITCFKANKPCSSGRDLLTNQMKFLNEVEENPFSADTEDVEDACPDMLLIEDTEDNNDIDILN